MSSIPETSTSLVLEAINEPLVLKKTPTITSPPPGIALVSMLAVGIRPHHRGGFRGHKALPFPVPYTPGNSGVARILAVGRDAIALQPGQLVWVNGFVTSRDDPTGTKMLLGLSHIFGEKREALFKAWPGLWADVASAPLENCLPLDEDLLCTRMGYSFADLEYLERLAVATGGVRAADLRPGETVIVNPATGHYSGAAAELAAQIGCHVIALTRTASKVQPLASLPHVAGRITAVEITGDADTDAAAIRAHLPPNSDGADALIDVSPPQATGSPTGLAAGLASLRSGGRAVFLGAMGEVKVNYASLMMRGITIRGQWMYPREWAVDLIKSVERGVVRLGRDAGHEVVGREFALEEWEEAIETAEGATQWGRHVVFTP
ncbi:hypothetical protein ACO1O0_002076 [Amphichorda felina]